MKKCPELILLGIDGGVPDYIREKVAEGKLPNFAKLIRKGTFLEKLHGVHPTVTPVCWSALQTGSTPEVNGIVSDLLHLEGPLSHTVSSYHGSHLKAERLWEAAARIGKTSLVTSFPVSGPSRSPLVRQIGGLTCSAGRTLEPDKNFEEYDIPYQLWFFDRHKKPVSSLAHFTVKASPVVQVQSVLRDLPQETFRNVSGTPEYNTDFYHLQVDLDRPHANRHGFAPFHWDIEVKDDQFFLHTENGILLLQENAWSVPFQRILPCECGSLSCSFRFGCFSCEDGYFLFTPSSGNIEDIVSPELHDILKTLPPVPVNYEYVFLRDPATAFLAFDTFHFNMEWDFELIRQAQKKIPSDIIVTYFGIPDVINHLFWPAYCGARPADEKTRLFASECLEKGYTFADEYLGVLMDEIAGDESVILVVSDHGSIGTARGHNPNTDMAEAGLVCFKNQETLEIDYSRTKAAAIGFGNIFVNLQGRETDGIVPPEEYDKTVNEIITALQDHMRSPDGTPFLAFAVRKAEAGFVGQGGERAGDVIYGASGACASITVHAEQIPSARDPEFGSMNCLGILAGSGVQEGNSFSGPVKLQDLAPTLAALLRYPLPRESNGRIVTQILSNEFFTGERNGLIK